MISPLNGYCQPGHHIAELPAGSTGWPLVRARWIEDVSIWVADESSSIRVPVCPEHSLTLSAVRS